jgi:hypothetical protein
MDPATPAPNADAPASPPPVSDAESVNKQNKRLDEELAETFPASDPIPFRHDS